MKHIDQIIMILKLKNNINNNKNSHNNKNKSIFNNFYFWRYFIYKY
jgi:hypothetical protein